MDLSRQLDWEIDRCLWEDLLLCYQCDHVQGSAACMCVYII